MQKRIVYNNIGNNFIEDRVYSPKPATFRHSKYAIIWPLLAIFGLTLIGFTACKKSTNTESSEALSVTPNEVSFEAEGGQARIEVKGDEEWDVENSTKSWCYYEKNLDGITITVNENNSDFRCDTIVVKGQNTTCNIIIKQESGAFYADPHNQTVEAGGGRASYHICGQKNWRIATNAESWGNVYREGENLIWEVSENNSPEERNDMITLQTDTKEIILFMTQPGCLTAEKMKITPGKSATTSRIKISGPNEWNADTDVWWADASREGDKLRIDIEKNEDGEKRYGTVTVTGGGQSIDIEIVQSSSSPSPYPFPIPPYGW